MKKREKANFRIVNQLKPGTKIRAIYADEENDPSWYDAVINSVEVGGYVVYVLLLYGGRVRRLLLCLLSIDAIVRGARTHARTHGSSARGV